MHVILRDVLAFTYARVPSLQSSCSNSANLTLFPFVCYYSATLDMSQSSIDVLSWKKGGPPLKLRRGNPNIFVPGQQNTFLDFTAEIQLMILTEHFSALRVGIRTVKAIGQRREAGVNPADDQTYLSIALVNHALYWLCLPLLYRHTIFEYSTSWSNPDLQHIRLSLNISFMVRVICVSVSLASYIADSRQVEPNGRYKSFPNLKYVVMSERISARESDGESSYR